jgi:large subunit ribosomal protein L17
MLRNLVTNLMTHQRITTTVERAKEIRPFVEQLIRRAKAKDYQGNVVLKQNLFTATAIKNVKEQFVPRFEN